MKKVDKIVKYDKSKLDCPVCGRFAMCGSYGSYNMPLGIGCIGGTFGVTIQKYDGYFFDCEKGHVSFHWHTRHKITHKKMALKIPA